MNEQGSQGAELRREPFRDLGHRALQSHLTRRIGSVGVHGSEPLAVLKRLTWAEPQLLSERSRAVRDERLDLHYGAVDPPVMPTI
jgi:hypothetical protein